MNYRAFRQVRWGALLLWSMAAGTEGATETVPQWFQVEVLIMRPQPAAPGTSAASGEPAAPPTTAMPTTPATPTPTATPTATAAPATPTATATPAATAAMPMPLKPSTGAGRELVPPALPASLVYLRTPAPPRPPTLGGLLALVESANLMPGIWHLAAGVDPLVAATSPQLASLQGSSEPPPSDLAQSPPADLAQSSPSDLAQSPPSDLAQPTPADLAQPPEPDRAQPQKLPNQPPPQPANQSTTVAGQDGPPAAPGPASSDSTGPADGATAAQKNPLPLITRWADAAPAEEPTPAPPIAASEALRALPPDQFLLREEAQRLRRANYAQIVHAAWPMPLMSGDPALAVVLPIPEGSGQAVIEVSRRGGIYAHLTVSLQAPDGHWQQLDQTRRLRSGGLHMLDNSQLLALVTIAPWVPSDPE